jgi:hypothetical protein
MTEGEASRLLAKTPTPPGVAGISTSVKSGQSNPLCFFDESNLFDYSNTHNENYLLEIIDK